MWLRFIRNGLLFLTLLFCAVQILAADLDLIDNRLFNFKPTGNPLVDISGFVISGQAGYADTHWDNANFTNSFGAPVTATAQNITGTTGGSYAVLLGYQYHFFGFEGGYYQLPTVDATLYTPGQASMTNSIKNYVLDFVAKMMVPIGDRFGVFAKAGVSDFHSTNSDVFVTIAGNSSSSADYIGPAFGLGLNFAITNHWIAEASWMRFTGQGSYFNDIEPFQPNPDVFMVGLSYKITTSSDSVR